MSDAVEGSISTEAVAEEVASTEVAQEAAPEIEAASPAAEPEAARQAAEDRKFAAKFAALSRREKQLKAQEREFQARLKQQEETAAKNTPKKEEIEPLEMRLKRNPLATLKELGLSYEQLTQIALNDGKLTPDIEMQLMRDELTKNSKSEVAELRAQLEADRKERKEQAEREASNRDAQAISAYKAQIADYVTAQASELELLAAEGEGAADMIFDVINAHYAQTLDEETNQGEVLDIKIAAEAVENHLLGEAKKRIGLNKIKKLLGASEVQNETQKVEQGKNTKASVTLSNEKSQVQSTKKSFLSDEDSKKEAAKLIVWNE